MGAGDNYKLVSLPSSNTAGKWPHGSANQECNKYPGGEKMWGKERRFFLVGGQGGSPSTEHQGRGFLAGERGKA